jgi:low temperature requirement protein LtrA
MSNPPSPSPSSTATVLTTTSSPTAQNPTELDVGDRRPARPVDLDGDALLVAGGWSRTSTTVPRRSVSIGRETKGVEETRVSTLELFFDLVFVFTITQLATVMVHHPDGDGVAQVAVMLAAIWWMYAGYAWLTNSDRPRRDRPSGLFLVGAMCAYLVLALAIPDAFTSTGLTFGLAYLGDRRPARRALHPRHVGALGALDLMVAQTNLLFAALIVVGGALGGSAQWVIW